MTNSTNVQVNNWSKDNSDRMNSEWTVYMDIDNQTGGTQLK